MQIEAKIKQFRLLKNNGEVLAEAPNDHEETLPITSILGHHNAALSLAKEAPAGNNSTIWSSEAALRAFGADGPNSGTIVSYTKALVSGHA
jgi:hypothetical protein